MKIIQNYDLTRLNTFGVPATAKFFVEIENELEIKELFTDDVFKNNQKLFLGGGSNILFTQDFDGLVVLNKLKGIGILEEDKESVLVRAMSGEEWHDIVLFAVKNNYWGIENLSLIPGTVGAAPMQNIGAYGAELKNTLVSVEGYDIESGEKKVFTKEECELGYRDSVFKNRLQGKYFIVGVTLKLSKVFNPNTSYKILKDHLVENKIEVKNSKDICDAVCAIRRSKLPDPAVIGNAGSFFKNVFLEKTKDKEKIDKLFLEYPEMPSFEEGDFIKIPSAWLIEQCGPANGASWKGKRIGNVGVHERQALVLVNHGGGTGLEIKNLSEQITDSVFQKFGLKISPEVNLI